MKKILLTILPYWDPMIPPMGIASLKSFLKSYDFDVMTVDFIVKKYSLNFYYNYFKILEECIPIEKQGNFRNIGHDVLQNHMMAHINHCAEDLDKYHELVTQLVYNYYYIQIEISFVLKLCDLISEFYSKLEEDFLSVLENNDFDIVGATVFKCTIPSTLFVLNLTKEKFPHIKTLMGGGAFNESYAPDSPNFNRLINISEKYIDKVFLGQGELLFLKYLRGELDDNKRIYTKQDIKNEILDFDAQDIPDFSDLDTSIYPYLAATSSAGCIYDCSFCCAKRISPNYRKNSPNRVVEQMRRMYNLHGHQLFFMTDSLINPVVTDLAKEFIKSDIALYYDAYFKVDYESADINSTLLWRKGGLYRVRLGTESGSQNVLNMMSKKITPAMIRNSVRALAYAGIKVTTYWVIGHPGETEEDFQMTLDLVEELKNDIYQAESNYFLYHYSRQASADDWAGHRFEMYPSWATEMLNFEHYSLRLEPSREEIFNRVHRFEIHCRKLGIPNPYSLNEHYEADLRWKKLHKNAPPSIAEFRGNHKYLDECKSIELVTLASDVNETEIEDFNF